MQRMSWPPLMALLIPPDPPDPPDPPYQFSFNDFLSSAFSISAASSSLNPTNLLTSFASSYGVVLISDILASANAMKLAGGLPSDEVDPYISPISVTCNNNSLLALDYNGESHRTWRFKSVSALR